MTSDAFFEMLRPRLLAALGTFRKRCTIAFAVIDGGVYVFDTHAPSLIEKTYRSGCDLSILCNTLTLFDIASGAFDLEAPKPHQLFRFGGDLSVLARLADALRGGQSMVSTRVQVAT